MKDNDIKMAIGFFEGIYPGEEGITEIHKQKDPYEIVPTSNNIVGNSDQWYAPAFRDRYYPNVRKRRLQTDDLSAIPMPSDNHAFIVSLGSQWGNGITSQNAEKYVTLVNAQNASENQSLQCGKTNP